MTAPYYNEISHFRAPYKSAYMSGYGYFGADEVPAAPTTDPGAAPAAPTTEQIQAQMLEVVAMNTEVDGCGVTYFKSGPANTIISDLERWSAVQITPKEIQIARLTDDAQWAAIQADPTTRDAWFKQAAARKFAEWAKAGSYVIAPKIMLFNYDPSIASSYSIFYTDSKSLLAAYKSNPTEASKYAVLGTPGKPVCDTKGKVVAADVGMSTGTWILVGAAALGIGWLVYDKMKHGKKHAY
jgi:hypothetical protein